MGFAVSGAPASLAAIERRRDRVVGLTIVAVAFAFSLAISYWAKLKSEPEQGGPLPPPTTERIEGFPNGVSAEKNLARAREVTRRLLLRGFVVEGARSDGTVDVSKPEHGVRYSFQSPAGHGPQPPREPGVVPRRDLCGRQSVWIRANGLAPESDNAEVSCAASPPDPLPDPDCSLEQVFKWAIEHHKVAPEALARVEYYRAHAGPAFRFESFDRSVSFAIDAECTRELTGREAAGRVP